MLDINSDTVQPILDAVLLRNIPLQTFLHYVNVIKELNEKQLVPLVLQYDLSQYNPWEALIHTLKNSEDDLMIRAIESVQDERQDERKDEQTNDQTDEWKDERQDEQRPGMFPNFKV